MDHNQERDGEEDIRQCGKTSVKDIWKVWDWRWRTYWTGQSGRMIFQTIPANQDEGKARGEGEQGYTTLMANSKIKHSSRWYSFIGQQAVGQSTPPSSCVCREFSDSHRLSGSGSTWRSLVDRTGTRSRVCSGNYGRVHTVSGSVPYSSESYTSGRLRGGFAFTLLTTDPTRTVRTRTVRRVHTASALRPVVTQLHVLNYWHISPFQGHVSILSRVSILI